MDMAEFNLIRPPHRAGAGELRLEATIKVDREAADVRRGHEPEAISIGTVPPELGQATTDPLAPVDAEGQATILAHLYALLGALDDRLSASGDRLDGDELDDAVTDSMKRFHLDDLDWAGLPGGAAKVAFGVVNLGLRQALISTLSKKQPDLDRAPPTSRRQAR